MPTGFLFIMPFNRSKTCSAAPSFNNFPIMKYITRLTIAQATSLIARYRVVAGNICSNNIFNVKATADIAIVAKAIFNVGDMKFLYSRSILFLMNIASNTQLISVTAVVDIVIAPIPRCFMSRKFSVALTMIENSAI